MAVFESALHLLLRALVLEIAKMSTSALALVAGLISIGFQLYKAHEKDGWIAVRREFWKDAGLGAIATMVVWVGLFFFFLVAAIYQDHDGLKTALIGKAKALVSATASLKTANIDCDHKTSDLQQQAAVKQAINDTLQKQNRDQQNTINGCLSQAIKMVQPESLKVTVLRNTRWPDNRIDPDSVKKEQPMTGTDILVLVNRPVICPCEILMTTDQVLLRMPDYFILGAQSMQMGGAQMLGSNAWRMRIESPNILPTRPLLITAYSKKNVEQVGIGGLQ